MKRLFCLIGLVVLLSFLMGSAMPSVHAQIPARERISMSDQAFTTPPADLRFEKLTPADGLSFPIVRSVIQDHQGFMWFGTESGLNQYNGYDFTVYKNHPNEVGSLSSDEQRVVFEDSDGDIWVGGAGGLERYNREQNAFSLIDDSGQVLCITQSSDGLLWVGFRHGLYGYDRMTEQKLFSYPSSAPEIQADRTISPGSVKALLEDSQGNLWVGTSAGLDRLDRKTGIFIHYLHDADDSLSLSNNDVNALYEDQQGDLWVGTAGGGLDRMHVVTEIFKHHRNQPDDPDSLSSDIVLSILQDKAGNLWVGTVNGLNLYLSEQNRFARFRHDPARAESLSDNIVYALFEDRSGVLWIATANGISKYIPRANQFVYLRWDAGVPAKTGGLTPKSTVPIDLGESKALAIYEDPDGILWFGTLLDGLYRFNPQTGQITIYRNDPQDPESLINNQVHAIYQDRVGIFWLGTGNGWLEQFDPQVETFLHSYQQDVEITSIVEDFDDNLWIGTQGRGLSHLKFDEKFLFQYNDPGEWIERDSLGSSIVETIYVDHAGIPWIGTYDDGISLRNPDGAHNVLYRGNPDDPLSLSHNHVIAFFEEPQRDQGIMWVGTMGGGLNRFDYATETFKRYTVADGLADDIVNCILADDAGFLWLSTPKGLTRFDPESEIFRNYDAADGVSGGTSYPGVCLRSQTGQMYFGTQDGVITFDPQQIEDNLVIPPIVITSFMANNKTLLRNVVSDDDIRLSFWNNNLAFEFSALDYTAPQKNQYSYRMDGLDDDWVFAGTRLRADYPDMQPGNYVFRVRGANNDGVWNEDGIAIFITLIPPFWTTWWFLSLLAIFSVGLIYAGYRWRVHNLEIQSRELETQVEERTQEINQRRRQIEALYRADENLYRHLDLDQVLQALVDTAVQILEADKGALLCWDETRQNLTIQAAHGFKAETISHVVLTRGEGVAGWVVERGQPATVQDTLLDARITQKIVNAEDIRAFMQVPIMIEDEIFGVFSADYLQPRAFDEDEKRLLVSLAQRAAMAIQNAQLYGQAREVAATQERTRLARELHDAVTQTLFSASLIAEALPALWERNPEKGHDRLAKLRQMSRGALAEMRALLLELRPAALMETSLLDLLLQLGEAVTGREGIPVIVEADEACKLPEDLHIVLYRIAQEALNNIVKHARSSQVWVRLTTVNAPDGTLQEVLLLVRDDGRGFDPQTVPPERMGLSIMRERAQSVGADLAIKSQPGQGTEIIVKWVSDVLVTPGSSILL